MLDVRMIAGLGNVGSEYTGTRHNVGFEVVDLLAGRLGVDVKKRKFGGLFGETVFGDRKLILLKPGKYMNRSGEVVATAVGFYKISLSNIIVVSDEMALEPGRIRIRSQGSAGGHNGLSDIISKLGSSDFARLRVGIGSAGGVAGADYVLSRPAAAERELIDKSIARSVEALECWLCDGIEEAMNRFNVRGNEVE